MQSGDVKTVIEKYRAEMKKRIVGQDEMLDSLLLALVAGGHILLEGVPGLAKTLAVRSLAEITGLSFKRIQFTPDLLPADLTGTLVWEAGNGERAGTFEFRKGPVFANVVLADEINRAPAKVQSALLEAMEERQVTSGDRSWPLPQPFFVLATQNPIEHEGTYSLPEAELDRFLFKVIVPYPSSEEEKEILERAQTSGTETEKAAAPLEKVLDAGTLRSLRESAERVHVDDEIKRYIVSIIRATRPLPAETAGKGSLYRYIRFGASPRAGIALYRCAKIEACFAGRDFVLPEDVKKLSYQVLRHRLTVSYEAEADSMDADAIIERLLRLVPAP